MVDPSLIKFSKEIYSEYIKSKSVAVILILEFFASINMFDSIGSVVFFQLFHKHDLKILKKYPYLLQIPLIVPRGVFS